MIRRHSKLLRVHVPANALLMWLAYEWLGVDESTVGRLLLSTVDAVAILTLVCWLWGATLVWFRSKAPTLNDSFRTSLRHIGGLLLIAIGTLILYGAIGSVAGNSGPAALKVASWLTWTLRKPVKPAAVAAIFTGIFWILRWAVLPVILIPAAAQVAAMGRSGWRALSLRHPWRQWVIAPVLALAGAWLPFVILNWKPKVNSFGFEFSSFLLRAALAYAIFLTAMLALAWSQSEPRGRAAITPEQPSPTPLAPAIP